MKTCKYYVALEVKLQEENLKMYFLKYLKATVLALFTAMGFYSLRNLQWAFTGIRDITRTTTVHIDG